MITETQQQVLIALRDARTSPKHLAQRAEIVLLGFEKLRNEQIAERVGVGRHQVGVWRRRWAGDWERLTHIECLETRAALERAIIRTLSDAPRPGAPGKLTPEQVTQIIALACEPPENCGRPISHWMHAELAAEAAERGLVESISATRVGELLREVKLQPHKSRYWLNTKEKEIDVPEWISIREDGAEHPTFVRGADVIVRRAPDAPRPEPLRLAPDAIPSPPPVRLPAAEAIVGHYVMGQPRPTDDRFKFTPPGAGEEVEGITVLVREAFTVGHYDKRRVPAWVAMSWTTDDFHRSEAVSFGRGSFVVDTDLPVYARGGTSFEFSRTQMERGHMARDADLEAWGFDAVR